MQSLGVQVDVNSNGSMKGEEDVGFTKVAVETLSRGKFLFVVRALKSLIENFS